MGAKDQGADAIEGRWLVIPRTLCFITHGRDVLLLKRGMHKRVYPGRYNGVGGHIERDEDPLTSALREMQEETGLAIEEVRLRGLIHVDAGSANGIMVFVFSARATSREFAPCDEGTLEWVPLDAATDLPLVEDLPALLPLLFDAPDDGRLFYAHSSYDADDQPVLLFAEHGARAPQSPPYGGTDAPLVR